MICKKCGVCKAQSGKEECVLCKLDRLFPTAPTSDHRRASIKPMPDGMAEELYRLWRDGSDDDGEPLSMAQAIKIMQDTGRLTNPQTGKTYGKTGGQRAINRMIAKHGDRESKKYRKAR